MNDYFLKSPNNGERSSKIKYSDVYGNRFEYKIKNKVTKKELFLKLIEDPEFRKKIKNKMDEKDYKVLTEYFVETS